MFKYMSINSITFTGGLGAQLISAGCYYYLEKNKIPIIANMQYFDMSPGININGLVHWGYDLDGYNIPLNSFNQMESIHRCINNYSDGGNNGNGDNSKLILGQLGLMTEEIRNKFPINNIAYEFIKNELNNKEFICIHIRRGDYLNVAGYIIPDIAYYNIIKELSKTIQNIVVVSDTPISDSLSNMFNALNINIIYMVGGYSHTTHGIMRLSNILICSNSQFSMSAAFLRNTDQITYIPSKESVCFDGLDLSRYKFFY